MKFWWMNLLLIIFTIIAIFASGPKPNNYATTDGYKASVLEYSTEVSETIYYYGLYILLFFNLLIVLYDYLYYKMYYYNFAEEKAVIRKGIVSRSTGHVNYNKIQNIYVDQDVLDRFLGIYDVHYETATLLSGSYSHISGLSKVNSLKLVDYLKQKCESKNDSLGLSKNVTVDDKKPEIVSGDESTINNIKISAHIIWIMELRTLAFIIFSSFLIIARTSYEFTLSESAIIRLILFIVVTIYLAITLLYNYLWYKNYNFSFTKDSVEVKEGVISTKESHLFYDRIQQVDITQGLIGRMIGLYVVRVESAGEVSGLSFIFPALKQVDAQTISDYLKNKSKKFKKV